MQAGWKVNIDILTNQPAHFIEIAPLWRSTKIKIRPVSLPATSDIVRYKRYNRHFSF